MNRFLFITFFLFSVDAFSQSNLDAIATPGFMMNDKLGHELAKLAASHYRVKIADDNVKYTQQEMDKVKLSWMNNFNASFNLNEFSLQNSLFQQQNSFFPRYNFSLSLPLGIISTKKKEIQMAKTNNQRSIDIRELEIQQLKEAVIQEYQTYVSNNYLLEIHQLNLQDEKLILDKVTQSFETNQIDIEAYTNYTRRYNENLTKKVTLLRDLNISRYRLEAYLGMDLDTALKTVRGN
jgi:outer membrane protein TolC